jgi:hypothetical protein
LRFVDRWPPSSFGAALLLDRQKHLLLARGGLPGPFSMRGGLAGETLLQGLHEVHNVFPAGPGFGTDSFPLALGVADAARLGNVQRHFLSGLIEPTGALHEPRPGCLGILLG